MEISSRGYCRRIRVGALSFSGQALLPRCAPPDVVSLWVASPVRQERPYSRGVVPWRAPPSPPPLRSDRPLHRAFSPRAWDCVAASPLQVMHSPHHLPLYLSVALKLTKRDSPCGVRLGNAEEPPVAVNRSARRRYVRHPWNDSESVLSDDLRVLTYLAGNVAAGNLSGTLHVPLHPHSHLMIT